MRHQHYVDCLINKAELNGEVTRIVSKNHQLKTQTNPKVLLSYSDNKRYILPSGIDTVALGHYSI